MGSRHHHDPLHRVNGTSSSSSSLSIDQEELEEESSHHLKTPLSPFELDHEQQQHEQQDDDDDGGIDRTALLQHDDDDDNDHVDDAFHNANGSCGIHTTTTPPFDASPPSGHWFTDWMYPPNVPRSCQLLRLENIAVPCCYLLVGLSKGLSGPLINVYPLDLNATEAQQVTFFNAVAIPASLKILFGFLSDNVPIFGYRRKSYMILGCLLTSMSFWGLLLFTNLARPIPDDVSVPTANAGQHDRSLWSSSSLPPSIPFLCLSFLLFSMGFWIADVMAESIIAEKAKLEPAHARGSIQSSCYAYRFFGKMISVPCATWLYSQVGPGPVFVLLSAFPLLMLPLIMCLKETQVIIGNRRGDHHEALPTSTDDTTATLSHHHRQVLPSTKEQCQDIWNAVCSRAVWQPMAFVYLFNLLQVNNAAWKQFLKTTLGFTANDLNIILVFTYALMYFGILAYKYCMLQWSWRSVYLLTTALGAVLSLLQVLLIQGKTFGLSKFLFCLGDEAFSDFIQGIQYMPTTIMMAHLCPTGSEGASFAMFTTASNCAQALSRTISTHLLGIWNVSKDALAHHQLQGLTNLTYLVTVLHITGILFISWLPNTKEDLTDLNQQTHKSRVGGTLFITITFFSVLYAVVVGVLDSVAPGWMGAT